MKKIIFSITCVLAACAAMAQSSKYEAAMKKNLTSFASLHSVEDAKVLSAAFERIGNAEKTQWLPYYYAGLCFMQTGFADTKTDKDSLATILDTYADKANAIHEDAENYSLKYVANIFRLMVDPMTRYQKYGEIIQSTYKKGIALDSLNPRLYFLRGSTVMNTPAFAGGGPKAAKPYFEKAAALFAKQDTTGFLPKWGAEPNAEMLKKCD